MVQNASDAASGQPDGRKKKQSGRRFVTGATIQSGLIRVKGSQGSVSLRRWPLGSCTSMKQFSKNGVQHIVLVVHCQRHDRLRASSFMNLEIIGDHQIWFRQLEV
jgi:hypothetical protein